MATLSKSSSSNMDFFLLFSQHHERHTLLMGSAMKGMLASAGAIEVVSKALAEHEVKHIVIDPVRND